MSKSEDFPTEASLAFEFAKALITARGVNTPMEEEVFSFSRDLASRFANHYNYPIVH